MNLDERLTRVAVLGAGGKMGSGISLLLAREMTLQALQPENRDRSYRLTLMDVNPTALEGLKEYLQNQGRKFAGKKGEMLKPLLPKATSEDDLSDTFVEHLTALLHPVTQLPEVKDCRMVFEAILEKRDLKVEVFSQLKKTCLEDAFFFSNTSSIPISEIEEAAGLKGRIIGFHFYNPPAVQKLVELIVPEKVHPQLPELSRELGQRLGKIIIPANDVAGFIGNGHFVRDGLYGIREAQRLGKEMGPVGGLYAVNRITRDFLIRPMGIFQLIDYVGLEVFQSILKIMNPHFEGEDLHSRLIDEMVASGVRGGQYSDGSQKDGFLTYKDGKPAGVYHPDKRRYGSFSEGGWKEAVDEKIGPLPEEHASWKVMLKHPDRSAALKTYFANLRQMDTPGARLALAYLKRSKEIGQQLVSEGVAHSAEDVNGVLMNGFFHLYGPVNDFV